MTVKIGIDSYCFHRYFGEVYEGLQTDPGVAWQMEREFLDYALAQDVNEVALESCFFDALNDELCAEIRARLDEAGVDRVLGWVWGSFIRIPPLSWENLFVALHRSYLSRNDGDGRSCALGSETAPVPLFLPR